MKRFLIATVMILIGTTSAFAKNVPLGPFVATMDNICGVAKVIKEKKWSMVRCDPTKKEIGDFVSVWYTEPHGTKEEYTQENMKKVMDDPKLKEKNLSDMKNNMNVIGKQFKMKLDWKPKVSVEKLGSLYTTVGEIQQTYKGGLVLHYMVINIWDKGSSWQILAQVQDPETNLHGVKQAADTLRLGSSN